MTTFRTPEEAIVEWIFASQAHLRLALTALKADIAAFDAKDELNRIEDYLVRTCPGAQFDLGDGRVATIGSSDDKPRIQVSKSITPECSPQNTLPPLPENEPNSQLSHNV